MDRRRKYLVTGGAGFIGSHLTENLLTTGARVLCFDAFDSYYDPAVKRARCEVFAKNPLFELVEGDIQDARALSAAFDRFRPDAVIHLAALAGVRPSLEHGARYHSVNVEGTRNVLEASRRVGVRRVVNASSSSVYGDQGHAPADERGTPTQPLSPYGRTKLDGEQLCDAYAGKYRLGVASLRFFTVYGPRQRPDMAITRFAKALLSGTQIRVFGDGHARRDFTYVDDVVSGIVKAARLRDAGHLIANIGTGSTTSLNELVVWLGALCRRSPQVAYLPRHASDAVATWANIAVARTRLGYAPTTSVREGLARVVESLRVGAQLADGEAALPLGASSMVSGAPTGPWPQSTTA